MKRILLCHDCSGVVRITRNLRRPPWLHAATAVIDQAAGPPGRKKY